MKTDEIRNRFLDFFRKRGHTIVRSDSLVPQKDPTLLFTGAGMNQFKDYFLGLKKDLRRAASSQKCLRTGDLDEVGRTPYHHSFFEMLGNFSFGDYFKEEAIAWAWEFLTEELKLSKERLRVSVHQDDGEAFRVWHDRIKVREDWIYSWGDKTNFWPSQARVEGPNGPCGPCSEIYYDQTPGVKESKSIEEERGRFAEIWNLVFTQFDRQEGGRLLPLKNKHIDTGMGLERLACVLQKKKTNFEIDIFEPLIKRIEEILKVKRSLLFARRLDTIVDHIRAATFAVGDGVIPGNEGRGYVIRKLIRRAIWHAHQVVPAGRLEKPTLYQLSPRVIELMEKPYPELREAEGNIEDILRGEEERFLQTLETGLELLREKIQTTKAKERKQLAGEEVFLLYDTYGFPDELTRVIAKGEGLEIDQGGFERLLEEQRKRAKGTSPIAESIFITSDFDRRLHELPVSKFLGYETRRAKGKVLLAQIEKDQGILVMDETPFYAESGGQVGDRGTLQMKNFEARVEDTQKRDQYILHHVHVLKGRVEEGREVEAQVDSRRREGAMRNHTATHLLHAVLRELLGKQLRQLGSLVAPDRLRFDYSFSRPLTPEELRTIENRVNEEIMKNSVVQKEVKDFESAKAGGAIAFFGEKYGDRVRVVTVPGVSQELCGGTHCDRTGQIGAFVITTDTSIASGVRRMEALTGGEALRYVQQLRLQLRMAAEKLRTTPQDLPNRIEKLQQRLKQLEKEDRERLAPQIKIEDLLQKAEKVGSCKLLLKNFEGMSREELRKISDRLRSQARKTLWLLFCKSDKIHFLIGLSADLKNEHWDTRELGREVAALIQGSGGGRKDFVEGGSARLETLEEQGEELARAARKYLKHASHNVG